MVHILKMMLSLEQSSTCVYGAVLPQNGKLLLRTRRLLLLKQKLSCRKLGLHVHKFLQSVRASHGSSGDSCSHSRAIDAAQYWK